MFAIITQNVLSQIIPPPEFSAFTKTLPKDYEMVNVVMQKAETLGKGYNLRYTKQGKVKFQKFEAMAKKMEAKTKSTDLSALEDEFWASLSRNSVQYGIDNEISLFDEECSNWNLGKLSSTDSLIHGHQQIGGVNTSYT